MFGASTPAFSFGSTPAFGTSSTPAFGTASTPAFGATGTSLFGSASTPAFGASSTPLFGASTPAFGAASTPAFGATPSPLFGTGSTPAANTPAFGFSGSTPAFGASSTPAFGAASTSLFGASTPGFGATTTPAFGATSQPAFGTGLFGTAASTPAFGTSFGGFGSASKTTPAGTLSLFPAASPSFSFPFSSTPGFGASTPSLFGPSTAAAVAQQAPTITYSTKYDDLPAERQKELLEIQRVISSYREDCEKLDRDRRLHDTEALKKGNGCDVAQLRSTLSAALTAISRDSNALADLRQSVFMLMRATESAIRTYTRSKLWRDAPQQYKGQPMPAAVHEMMSAPVVLPSPYLEHAINGFMEVLSQYRQVVSELEGVMSAKSSDGSETDLGRVLPTVISYLHDYFVHVAATLESLHNQVQRSKSVFLEQRRAGGDMSDPFESSKRMTREIWEAGAHLANPLGCAMPASGMVAGLPGMHHTQPAAAGQSGMLALPAPFASPGLSPSTSTPAGFNMANAGLFSSQSVGPPAANGAMDPNRRPAAASSAPRKKK